MVKIPNAEAQRWLYAAELAAGRGSGWPARFAVLAADAAKKGVPGAVTVTTQHLHNLTGGHRPVTTDMWRLLQAVMPLASGRMFRESGELQKIGEEIQKRLGPLERMKEPEPAPDDFVGNFLADLARDGDKNG
jgi:hypothetical protein